MTGFIEKGEGGLLPRDREKGKPFTDGERHELTCLQTKESQRFPAATSISERDIENTLKGNQPCQHLDFRLLVLLELWENIFLIFLSHQSCDNWFGHPEKIDPTTMRSIIGRTGLYTNLTVTEWWSWGLKRKRKKKPQLYSLIHSGEVCLYLARMSISHTLIESLLCGVKGHLRSRSQECTLLPKVASSSSQRRCPQALGGLISSWSQFSH